MDSVLLQGRFRDPVHRDSWEGCNPAHGLVIVQVQRKRSVLVRLPPTPYHGWPGDG